jgi:hypothetical protein
MIFNLYCNHYIQYNWSKNKISKIYHEIGCRSSPYILRSIFISFKRLSSVNRLGMKFITPSWKDVSTIHTVACIIFTSWVIIAIGYPHLICISAYFYKYKEDPCLTWSFLQCRFSSPNSLQYSKFANS